MLLPSQSQPFAPSPALTHINKPKFNTQDGRHFNERWGFLSRAGLNDKSQLCRQIEKYADVYTSRVSNLMRYTPYMYFRSPSQSLAHDRGLTAWYEDRLRAGDASGGDVDAGAAAAAAAAGKAHTNGGTSSSGSSISHESLSSTSSDAGGTAATSKRKDSSSSTSASSIGAP